MKKATVSKLALVAAVAALGAGTALAADSETQIPTSGQKVDGAPFEFKADWGTLQTWGGAMSVTSGGNPVAVTGYSWGAGSNSTMELQAATSQNGSHRTIAQLTRP